MLLKDVSSFVSEKMEEDWQRSFPSCRQPNSWQKRNGDPQTSRSSHIDRGKISMGDYHGRRESTMEHRGKSTMEQNRAFPWAREVTDGKQWPETERSEAKLSWQMPYPVNVSWWRRPKCPKVTQMTHFKTLSWNRGGEWPSRTLTMWWLTEPQIRVTFRDTDCVEAHSLELYCSHWATNLYTTRYILHHLAPITPSSPALDTGQAAVLQEISPLASYKKKRLADRKSSWSFNIKHWTSSRTLWGHCEWLERHTWHFNPNWLLSRPLQWLLQQNIRNWLLSRPLQWLLQQNVRNWLLSRPSEVNVYWQNDSFQDPYVWDSFKDPYILHRELTPFKTPTISKHTLAGTDTPSSELSQM